MNLELDVEKKKTSNGLSDITIINLKGRLDVLSTPEFEKQLDDIVEKGDKNILINLQGVRYISSSGVRLLLMLKQNIKKKKGEIALCNSSDFIDEVLELSGVFSVISHFPSEQEALSFF